MECLLPYLCMATVPHVMVGLERMLDCRCVGLERFHCTGVISFIHVLVCTCKASPHTYLKEEQFNGNLEEIAIAMRPFNV